MNSSDLIQTDTQVRQASPAPPPATKKQRALPLLIAVLIIVIDQFSKLSVEAQLPLNHTWAPFPEFAHLFRFTHVSNTGAAFGLFPGGSPFFTVVAIAVAAIIVIYNFGLPAGHFLLRLALGLQLGGALGNLIDRFRLGHVTDFLDFGPWPVFNLADTSIVAGVVILGVLMVLEQRQLAAEESHAGNTADEAQKAVSSLPAQRQNEQAT